jgi:hypothetical protein
VTTPFRAWLFSIKMGLSALFFKNKINGVFSVSPEDNKLDETKVVSYAAIRYGAWLLGLIIVLYFLARHLFPFIRSLF